MFFPEKIVSIKQNDKVLEIGPGATPFHRSDVLLEKKFSDEKEYEKQFGHSDKLITDKPIVFYEGEIFPFKDKEFDYVICSHVLEHVQDVPHFLSEVFRVASRGYFEFPLPYYEFLYNIDAHISFLKYDEKTATLNYMPKKSTNIDVFKPIQSFFLESLRTGHSKMITDMPHKFIQGFEWNHEFESTEVNALDVLMHESNEMPLPSKCPFPLEEATFMQLLKKLIKRIIGK
jgi:hypothetical protein